MTRRADVVVVGAGVIGCSLAFHLARAGRRVIVVERGAIGQGSTAACAGGVRAQFSTEINILIGMQAKQALARFEQEVGTPAGFRPVGYLFLLTTEEERARFSENARLQRRLGVEDVVELSPRQVEAIVPGLRTDDLSGATFCPSDGLAGPNEVTAGYAGAARRLGAIILEDSPVGAFIRRGGRIEGVETGTEAIHAAEVVICAGPWAAAVGSMAGLTLPITASRRHIFTTAPFSGISAKNPMTIDFHTSFYFHPEGEGVLFGMGDADEPDVASTSVDRSVLERLLPVAAHRWPPLLEARVNNAWAGLYENTPDAQPLVGTVGEGLWVAAGFSGHGFMMGPVIGDWLAQWMTSGAAPVDLTAFKPDRFVAGHSEPERNVV
ncbi:MAG: FAD-binding oxidoreductase [Candidatus Dormibacteraeota bacterium]|nr:FAD-binding oxidoreductase [Candidatus Dormibacteraeota bacterium]